MEENGQQKNQSKSQAPWRNQLQMILGFLLVLVIIAMVAVFYLNVTAKAVASGYMVQKLQNNIDDAQQSITNLETQLAEIGASDVMEKRAKEMGFHQPNPGEVLYFKVPGYAGRQEAVLAPQSNPVAAGETAIPKIYTESLVDWFRINILSVLGFSGGGQQ